MKAWEDICQRCGLCCYDRRIDHHGGLAVDLSSPCGQLDTESQLCRVYERRFTVCQECRKVTVFLAVFNRYLPDSCAYARRFSFLRALALGRRPANPRSGLHTSDV